MDMHDHNPDDICIDCRFDAMMDERLFPVWDALDKMGYDSETKDRPLYNLVHSVVFDQACRELGLTPVNHCDDCDGHAQRYTADGTPTTRRWEPYTPADIERYTAGAAEGDAMSLLQLDIAKLPEDEQDVALDQLMAEGLAVIGPSGCQEVTQKAKEILVAEGRLEFFTDADGNVRTRLPGGPTNLS